MMRERRIEMMERMAQVLKILAHPQRLQIIEELKQAGEAPVHVLTEALGVPQSAMSHHLSRLKNVKLIESERRGKEMWYRISDPRALTILACIGKTGEKT